MTRTVHARKGPAPARAAVVAPSAVALAVWGILGLATIGPAAGVAGAAPGDRAGAAAGAVAGRRYVEHQDGVVLQGRPAGLAASKADTVYLIGGRDRGDGKFQQDDWESWPDAEGWQTLDLTERSEAIWHRDTFNAALLDTSVAGNHAMWCGKYYQPCGGEPTNPGYGNNYQEYLDWYGIVPQPSATTTVNVTARLNYDTEPGYDYLYLEVDRGGAMSVVAQWTGSNRDSTRAFVPVDVDLTFTVGPGEYVGANHDRVHLRWRFASDGAWSDQDCSYPTAGGAQIDQVVVSFGGVPWTIDGFEPGSLSNWQVEFPPGVGDFGYPWIELQDLDECNYNHTARFAFVDDGRVLPETGGTPCITWCYGPYGYTVNPVGGLAGPDFHLHNEVWSPPLPWPEGDYVGATLGFDVYRHEELGDESVWPGVFYVWHVQSTADPAGLTGWSGWYDREYVYYGGPDWVRHDEIVSDLLVPGRKWVQISLGVMEAGYNWGYEGIDATPAPYFDNVSLRAYQFGGPAISVRQIDLAQDSFPESHTIDYANPGANSVRFDMAQNIATQEELVNLPGDSLVCDVSAVRTGAVLAGPPRLVYNLRRNPIFDDWRTSGLPDQGSVPGDSVRTRSGTTVRDRWCFDLPDTGFLFPGDVLHYYLEARDDVGGQQGLTRLPGDTTGFSLFPGDPGYVLPRYPEPFEMRALPSLKTLPEGDQPPILFWNDFGHRGGLEDWTRTLTELALVRGRDYDLYTTMGPSSAVGNGLGGRATAIQLAGYTTLLYTSGDLSAYTMTPVDFENDPGDDLGVVDSWLQLGGRKALLTGDGLVADLASSSQGAAFIGSWLQVNLISANLRTLVGGQAVPLVRPLDGNSVFPTGEWRVYGGCPIVNTFAALEPQGVAEPLAEFLPEGGGPAYPYAAGVRIYNGDYDADVILLPYDLGLVMTPNGGLDPVPDPVGQTDVMRSILLSLGHLPGSQIVAAPSPAPLAVRVVPNPFNPTTSIEYLMPRAGRLRMDVYDLRGRLVRTLVDGDVPAGPGLVRWDGLDAGGAAVASGVYFCETRALGERRVQKLALIR